MLFRALVRASLLLACLLALACATAPRRAATFSELRAMEPTRSWRYSSSAEVDWANSNGDARPIEPGQSITIADIQGPGIIRHIWFTVASPDAQFSEGLVLRAWWDGEAEPSIEAPLGSFFALGHGERRDFSSSMVAVSAEGRAFNCYWPMPFREGARLEVTNELDTRVIALYWYVDGGRLDSVPANIPYFHARYRQEWPARPGNYKLVETRGAGFHAGTVLNVVQLHPGWFGEGDDFFWLDGEAEPSLRGTGTEDYFGDAWGFREYHAPHQGVTVFDGFILGGLVSAYRWHDVDPIVFTSALRAEIEHKGNIGDADRREVADPYAETDNLYSSVAFWYQTGQETWTDAWPPLSQRRLPSVVVEAEDFIDRARHSGAAGLMTQEEHFWSGGAQLFLLAPDAGAELVLPIDVPVSGKQRVELLLTRAQDYGIYDVYWGERLVAENVDLWAAQTSAKALSLGVLDVEAGTVELRFVNRGAGPFSRRLDVAGPGHMLGLDAVRLVDLSRWIE